MQNPEKFLSLLYMATGTDEWYAKITETLLFEPQNLKADAYYLVTQMPLLEMFGKTPEDLTSELGEYTIAADWKTTGRRSIRIGDIVCVGCTAYVTLAELDVVDALKARFRLLPRVNVKRDNNTYRIGIIELPEIQALKDIICQHSKKV